MKIENIIKKIIAAHPTSTLSVGVSYRKELSWQTYGNRTCLNEGKLPNYEIGSLTKVFTAFYFIKLFQKKVVTSQTKINEIISSLPEKEYPTISDLLMHRSGYGYLTPLKLNDFIKIIKHKGTRQYNPYESNMCSNCVENVLIHKKINTRHRYVYSNFGYAVLGLIISRLEANIYENCMNSFLKDKLELTGTNFGMANLLPGYFRNRNYGNWQWDNCENNVGKAAGGLKSNIIDMLKFSNKLFMEPVFQERPESFSLMGMVREKEGLWLKVGQTGTQLSIMVIDINNSASAVVLINCLSKHCISLANELIQEAIKE